MSTILFLLDYKNRYLTSIGNLHDYTSMNVERISTLLREYGHTVEVTNYAALDLTRDFQGCYILYQAAEDVGLFYKDYIEDIVYYLHMHGAILLPGYPYFLAHHNKNFMELLRSDFKNEALKTIRSRLYGTAQEAIDRIDHFPVVLKLAEGRGSNAVFLATCREDFAAKARQISGVFLVSDFHALAEFVLYMIGMKLLHRVQTKYRRDTFNRRKFIVQDFIQGLQGDYKVLYFGGKYYTVYRKNRVNDFRASGSGRILAANEYELPGLLDFARKVTLEVEFPIIGMDIGFDGRDYYLFEFQCIHIGPYALQASEYWHEYRDGQWMRFSGRSNLEEEFCRTIDAYVRKHETT